MSREWNSDESDSSFISPGNHSDRADENLEVSYESDAPSRCRITKSPSLPPLELVKDEIKERKMFKMETAVSSPFVQNEDKKLSKKPGRKKKPLGLSLDEELG